MESCGAGLGEVWKGFVMSEVKKNNNALDIARLVAICAVILLHTVTGVLDNYPKQMSGTQIAVYSAIKCLCEIGVPLFLMISGALMLDPERNVTWERLHKKNIRRLVLALLIFGTVFALGECVYNTCFASDFHRITASSDSVGGMFMDSLKAVLTGKSWAHLWYMYIIIGIYLLLPILRAFTERAEEKAYGLMLLLLILMQSVVPVAEELLGWRLELELPIKGIYLTYFLLGYYLVKYDPFHVKDCNTEAGADRKSLYLAGILMAVLAVILSFEHELSNMGYSSPIVLVIAVSVFVRILTLGTVPASLAQEKTEDGRKKGFVYSFRSLSFGMYLIHTVFLNFCYKVLGITPLLLGGYVLIPVIAVLDFAFAYIAAWIMKKLPWFGKNVV